MKILITGGLGFVGGRTANYLKQYHAGSEIVLSTTRKTVPSWAHNFKTVQLNMGDVNDIRQVMSELKPDAIIHCAAVDQARCQQDPDLAQRVNALGTKHLIHYAKEFEAKHFIYFSTFQVYGRMSGVITEETQTLATRTYPVTKLNGEKFIQEEAGHSQIKTLIFRLSNSYGYPMDLEVGPNIWTLVYNAFARQILQTGEISIRSNQYRDFIAMEDVTRAVQHFLFNIEGQWKHEVFNLGGEQCLSIEEVARNVGMAYSKKYNKPMVKITVEESAEEGQYNPFQYSIEKLRKTGFTLHNPSEKEILGILDVAHEAYKRRVA